MMIYFLTFAYVEGEYPDEQLPVRNEQKGVWVKQKGELKNTLLIFCTNTQVMAF